MRIVDEVVDGDRGWRVVGLGCNMIGGRAWV